MFFTLLISLILQSGSGSFPTDDRQAATGSLYVCPGNGYSTEMRLSDFTPAPNSAFELRDAVNAQLSSAQRGKLGLKLDACCPGHLVYEVPFSGWSYRPRRGAHVYDVTITKVMCY